MSEADILPLETMDLEAEFSVSEDMYPEDLEVHEVSKGWSRRRKVAVGIAATISLLGLQNRELIHAAYNYRTYEPPAHDWDIIPEKTGCRLTDSEELRAYEGFTPDDDNDAILTLPATDAGFLSGYGGTSAARSFSVRQQNDFMHRERLFWPGDNYFDTKVSEHYSERLTMDFELWTRTGDDAYTFDTSAFEQIADGILSLSEIHGHPHVQQLVQCYAQRYAEGFGAGRTPVKLGVIADTDKCLDGNSVATLHPGQSTKDCHTIGVGSPQVTLSLGPFSPIDERYLIVTPANKDWDNFEETLNTRFLHELIHIIFFDDLSDFFAEQDEQERFVDYITTSLKEYYSERGGVPRVIVISNPRTCSDGSEDSCIRVEPPTS